MSGGEEVQVGDQGTREQEREECVVDDGEVGGHPVEERRLCRGR